MLFLGAKWIQDVELEHLYRIMNQDQNVLLVI